MESQLSWTHHVHELHELDEVDVIATKTMLSPRY